MSEGEATRKLAAILAADVAGYTRLMETDEDSTLSSWWSARNDIIDPAIASHGGRIVKHTGDGFLAEFPTATEAVRCAVEMQTGLAATNEGVDDDRRFDFRMGVNIGEIVADHEDIYGDGVNVAARLESLADPGGVCISASAYQQVKNRLDYEYEDLGSKKVKHVAEPVRHYRVKLGTSGESSRAHAVRAAKRVSRIGRYFTPFKLIAATVAVFAVIGLLLPGGSEPPANKAKATPIISVSPFRTIGDMPQQGFSEGLTEDLLTALSSRSGFRVIRDDPAQNQNPSLLKKASYQFEGSVRRVGDTVRVSAQLVDPKTGLHLWGGRYDRELVDVLSVQNEVAVKIVLTLADTLADTETERGSVDTTAMGSARDILYRGLSGLGRFAEMAAFLPQELFNWVSNAGKSDSSSEGRAEYLEIRLARHGEDWKQG